MKLQEAVEQNEKIVMGMYTLERNYETGIVGSRKGYPVASSVAFSKLAEALNKLSLRDGFLTAILRYVFHERKVTKKENKLMNDYCQLTQDNLFKLIEEIKVLESENKTLRWNLRIHKGDV